MFSSFLVVYEFRENFLKTEYFNPVPLAKNQDTKEKRQNFVIFTATSFQTCMEIESTSDEEQSSSRSSSAPQNHISKDKRERELLLSPAQILENCGGNSKGELVTDDKVENLLTSNHDNQKRKRKTPTRVMTPNNLKNGYANSSSNGVEKSAPLTTIVGHAIPSDLSYKYSIFFPESKEEIEQYEKVAAEAEVKLS